MKKKIVLFGVALAALATFNSCSNENDLTQVMEQPAVKGTPFSVSAFENDTRAIRYGSDGTGKDVDGTASGFVSWFKLYGSQATATPNVWIDNVVYTREAAADKFTTTAALNWPEENTETPTSFYAITDNDASGDLLTGTVAWTPSEGKFTYTIPTTTATVKYVDYDEFEETSSSKTVVNIGDLRDLMVASENTAETTDGKIPLDFQHALSSIAINVWFVSGQANTVVPATVSIKSVMLSGVKGFSTYTFGSGFAAPTSSVIYYKEFGTPIEVTKEPLTAWDDPTLTPLVAPGEWLVIPQTCTPWDRSLWDDDFFPGMDGAYISLTVETSQGVNLISFPLTTNTAHKQDVTNNPLSDLANVTFSPGKTRIINLNVAFGREHYLNVSGTTAQFAWEPGTFDIH